LGRDISIADLLSQGHNAVFLAVGGWDSRLARTGGEGESSPVPGCHLLIDIMKAGSEGYPQVNLNGHTIVIGNSNMSTAMVQRCKDLGAQKVSVMMREAAPTNFEVADAIVYGGISRLYGRDNQLTAVGITDLGSGDIQKVEADHIVFAAGRMPELIFIPAPTQEEDGEVGQKDANAVEWEALPPYKRPAYRQEAGLMANGDVMTDFSAAIEAIGAGRRAAASIHQTMYGIELDLPKHVVAPDTPVQNVNQVSLVPMQARQLMSLSDGSLIAKGAELEQGFDAHQAASESNRCLQCGLICYLHDSETQEKQPEAATP
jgi:NADPH-dependent glutamate synthase beta subunit-like oxidoreductase